MNKIKVFGENGETTFYVNQMLRIYGCFFEVIEITEECGNKCLVIEVSKIDENYHKNNFKK